MSEMATITFDEIKELKASREELRDRFATAALQGLLACPDNNEIYCEADDPCQYYAKRAYKYADAMLRARQIEPVKQGLSVPIKKVVKKRRRKLFDV